MFMLFFLLTLLFSTISCELWCYSCVSSQPGCEEFYVDWRIHGAITCPRDDDKCVKVIERKGVDKFITRDCLSNLESQKKDIPADRYDGCRKAAEQPKLAVYVENHISQLEIKNVHYDEVTYCFCEYDQWCNDGYKLKSGVACFILEALFLIAMCFLQRLF
ncbi:uncharacterized protein LOC129231223 isoform X1 [Uloborus diversus]|uniref:uncharacterized protein LOC129231223 isoform X1 n=1 Tax=Uloborus diversus TaxID=327109 RepID=UPI002409C940|nr:uncharacterized protein LOC129231223 isoform X1 [Uloborus diversus]